MILSNSYANDYSNYCILKIEEKECYYYKTFYYNNTTDWQFRVSIYPIYSILQYITDSSHFIDKNKTHHNYQHNFVNYHFIYFIAIINLLLYNTCFIIKVNNLIKEIIYFKVQPSDFTLMISGIDKNKFQNEEELQKEILEIVK